jgi:hypothetical protein
MRVERHQRTRQSGRSGSFDDFSEDRLMREVETVEHTERDHGGDYNTRLVQAPKNSHGQQCTSTSIQLDGKAVVGDLDVPRQMAARFSMF